MTIIDALKSSISVHVALDNRLLYWSKADGAWNVLRRFPDVEVLYSGNNEQDAVEALMNAER